MLARFGGVVLVSLWVLAACGSKESSKAGEPASKEAPPNRADPAKGASPVLAKPRKAPADIPAQEVEKLVTAWVEAQNEGNFDAYQELYASKFFGIKRVGEKKSSYDRAAWLADRGRMFKKRMTVEATGLSISTTPITAVVQFTQSWSSGKYSDVGPKVLNLMIEGGTLKIAREEMLQSRPAPALEAWVQAHRGDEEVTEADEVPAPVIAELTKLADGVAPGDEKLGDLQWAKVLSDDLVLFEIASEVDRPPVYDSEGNDDYDDPSDRGDTANLVLLARSEGKFVVASVASEEGATLELQTSVDLDGDRVADAVFHWSWYHDHEGERGIAVALTRSRMLQLIQLADGGGEEGSGWGRTIHSLCWTRLDGEPAILMAYMNEASGPEGDGNPYDDPIVDYEAPGFVGYRFGEGATFLETPLFAYWTKRAPSAQALGPELDGHRAPPGDDENETPDLTACRDFGQFAVLGLATSAMTEDAYLVTGLSTSEAGAKQKAAAGNQPANRVLELGDWQTFMKRKNKLENAYFEMPRKK